MIDTIPIEVLNKILEKAKAIGGNSDAVAGAEMAVRYIKISVENHLKKEKGHDERVG